MRTLLLMLALLMACITAQALPEPSVPAKAKAVGYNTRITLNLENASAATAIEQLLAAVGQSFTISNDLSSALSSSTVTMKIEFAKFGDALDTLICLSSTPIVYTVDESGNYAFYTAEEANTEEFKRTTADSNLLVRDPKVSYITPNITDANTRPDRVVIPSSKPSPTPCQITLDLPAMKIDEASVKADKAIAEAVANGSTYLAPGPISAINSSNWNDRLMPGVKFYCFPAALVQDVLYTAAKVYDINYAPTVTNVDGEYKKTKLDVGVKNEKEYNVLQGSFRYYDIINASKSTPVSLAAYKWDATWKYVVIANGADRLELAKKILDMAGMNYTIDDNNRKSSSTTRVIEKVSAKMTAVTLDEALKTILEPAGLTYRKSGSTYVIHLP